MVARGARRPRGATVRGRRLRRPPGAPPAAAPATRSPGASFELGVTDPRELRIVKDADEIALLTEAAHAADRVVAQIAAGRLVGRTEADVAREVRERLIAEGHDDAAVRDRRLGPELGLAAPRGVGAGHPGRRADRARHRRHDRRLRLGHHPDAVGDRRRPGQGPDERFRHLFGVLHGAQAAATRAVRPGVRPRPSMRPRAEPIERRGLRRGVLPPDRPRDRPRRARGSVHHRRQPRAAPARGWPSRSSPASTSSGEYGARIEDIVVCGPDGPIALNEAPRELYVVDG